MVRARPRKQSTFLERFGFGLLLGSLTALAATTIAGDDYDVVAALGGLAAGSAGGVILLGLKREGAEPFGTVVGAEVGLGLAAMLYASASGNPEGPTTGDLIAGIGIVLLPPIGAVVGHGIACGSCRQPSRRAPPL